MTILIFSAIAILAIFGVFATIRSQPEPPKNEYDQQQPQTEQREAQPRVDSNSQNQTEWWDKYKQKIKERWARFIELTEKYDKAIVALSTMGIFLFTLALFLATYLLYTAGERHSERQLRAYVFISGAHLENIGLGQIPHAQVTIKNFGQTPAYKMTQWTRIGIGRFPLEEGHLTRNNSESLPERPLPPQGEIPLQSPKYKKPLNAEMLDEFSKGMLAIYLDGEIRYRDAFKKKRRTRYLLFGGGSIGLSGELAAYKDGNDAT